MKLEKRGQHKQRKMLDQKTRAWLKVRSSEPPPIGWLKAIRTSLGISTRQMAEHLGMTHANLMQLETREAQGKVTLEMLNRVAAAMQCKVVYAIVPNTPYSSLESILDEKAEHMSKSLVQAIDQTMRLEAQGVTDKITQAHIHELAMQLKDKLDPRLWDKTVKIKKRKSTK